MSIEQKKFPVMIDETEEINYGFSKKINQVNPSVIRKIFEQTTDRHFIRFSLGNPDSDSLPVSAVEKAFKDIYMVRPEAVTSLQYASNIGYQPLRKKIADMALVQGEYNHKFDDIIITAGAQQAIELSAKVFLDEGDIVLVEEPTFVGALNAFRSYNARIKGIPLDNDGINTDILEKTLRELKANKQKPKLLYLIPNFQNPTGVTLSLPRRKRILELAYEYDFIIVEDDPYGKIRFEGKSLPSLRSLEYNMPCETGNLFDKNCERVIYVGSFSKTISPGMRVGYMLAGKVVIDKVLVAVQASTVQTNTPSQMAIYRLLEGKVNGFDYEEHIKSVCAIYKKKCSAMVEGMERYVLPKLEDALRTNPSGGFFLYLILGNIDAGKFQSFLAREFKVAVVPGNAFMPDENQIVSTLRLNFSVPTISQIEMGCKNLGTALEEFLLRKC